MHVRPLRDDERDWVAERVAERWADRRVVSRGRVHDAASLPGLVCEEDGRRIGLVTYDVRGDALELVTVDAYEQGRGAGSALLAAAAAEARARGCRRVWLITTNDNTPALRFYQRCGMRLAALHRDAIAESRRLKPSIPERGLDGIPICDEIELELPLE